MGAGRDVHSKFLCTDVTAHVKVQAIAVQPIGQKSQRVVDRRSGHLHVKGTMRVQDLKCEWSVRKRSSKTGTTTTANET